jgi:hypothetical protein
MAVPTMIFKHKSATNIVTILIQGIPKLVLQIVVVTYFGVKIQIHNEVRSCWSNSIILLQFFHQQCWVLCQKWLLSWNKLIDGVQTGYDHVLTYTIWCFIHSFWCNGLPIFRCHVVYWCQQPDRKNEIKWDQLDPNLMPIWLSLISTFRSGGGTRLLS